MTTTDLKQGTAEWLEARRGLLTASGVASIMGDSPFASAAVYMRRLVTETIDGPVELDAPPLNWGKENEHNARRLYEFLHDVQVEETGLWTNTWDLIPVGASPDGLVGEEGLVELKCPYGIRNEEKPQFKSIFRMPHYMHQVQMQLRITDRKWCDFFQWTPHGHKYERVSREDKWFDEVIEPMKEFYAAYLVAVKSAELGGPEEKCGMSARWAAAAESFKLSKEEAQMAEQRLSTAKLELEALCSEAGIDQCAGAGIKMVRVLRKGTVDYQKLAKEQLTDEVVDDIAEDYRRKGSKSWTATVDK